MLKERVSAVSQCPYLLCQLGSCKKQPVGKGSHDCEAGKAPVCSGSREEGQVKSKDRQRMLFPSRRHAKVFLLHLFHSGLQQGGQDLPLERATSLSRLLQLCRNTIRVIPRMLDSLQSRQWAHTTNSHIYQRGLLTFSMGRNQLSPNNMELITITEHLCLLAT